MHQGSQSPDEKDSAKIDLAFTEANLSYLVKSITQLKETGLPFNRSLAIISDAEDRVSSIPGYNGYVFKEKLAQVLQKLAEKESNS